jgi:SAM-dependent methyltransferase
MGIDVYAPLVDDYEGLVCDGVVSGGSFVEAHAAMLDALPPGTTVLDCACGTGADAIALARRGHSVAASDVSPAMVALAKARIRDAGASIGARVCGWDALGAHFEQQFDLVLCVGNAIVHAEGPAAMLRALRGMWRVTKDGGRLILRSRNWEALRAWKPRVVVPGQRRTIAGRSGLAVYVWTIPARWDRPHIVEVVLLLDEGARVAHRRSAIVYRPFRLRDLLASLATVGFTELETVYAPSFEWYTVTALKARR